jgi:tetratricopeptide (TPR) repeat protein
MRATQPKNMLAPREAAKWLPLAQTLPALVLLSVVFSAHAGNPSPETNGVEVMITQGTVEVARAGQTVRDLASTQLPYRRLNPGDQIWTGDHSRATLRLSDLTIVELGPNSHLLLLRPEERRPGFSLTRGLLHLFHRDKPGEFYFRTPTASPVIRGTELNLAVSEDGATTVNLLEGEVALTNELGQADLKSGEAAVVQPGHPPSRIRALEAVNVIQWCLYYPAVLDVEELPLTPEEQIALGASLAAYRQGDLLAALAAYPAMRQPGSGAEKIYLAALLLTIGEVSNAEGLLNSLGTADERERQLATALKTLIAAVKFEPRPEPAAPPTAGALASSLLAESYYQQSHFELEQALQAARAAVEKAPNFAFGWARVAELEFSFGRIENALEAEERALELAPRQAEALAVKGFLLVEQSRVGSAIKAFDEAISVDGSLANAWLGRGLCRIRIGQTQDGVADLVIAAALEPNRALLRSYLGKGFSQVGDEVHARSELARAKQLDPNDPTSWFYSALLNQQDNRLNEAVRDLERSVELNDNRQVYRSRLLLDQDLAVRQANLAAVYQDAGLFDQSVREASRALTSDYANYSAHLFLANSYAPLRDQNLVNLRYETVTLSEYLMAQLLAPVGGSALSTYVSQQEYSRLFDSDGFGLSSGTQYSSRGDWQQHGVQYGRFNNFDYALDAYYTSQNGQRPNEDLSLLSLTTPVRVQLSPQDTVFLQPVVTELESGDTRQYYDPAQADLGLRIKDSQEPNLFAGYHHTWTPGSHTLFLAGLLHDRFRLDDASVFIPTLREDFLGIFGSVPPAFSQFNERQHAEFVAGSAELQQIFQLANNTLILGGRFQYGETDSKFDVTNNPPSFGNLTYPTGTQQAQTHLQRGVVYAYDNWQVCDPLWLIGGVSFDSLSYPANIDLPPITDEQKDKQQVSPKAGVIWQPTPRTVFRGAYTRSLGGLYYDNSVRLEPTQVAGFNQAFRSLIPESVAGLVAGAEFETGDVDFSWRLPSGTYLGVGGEWLRSCAERTIGVYVSTPFSTAATASSTPQQLEFKENSLSANINQLLGTDWALGARYRVSRAELHQNLFEVPVSAVPSAVQDDSGILHQLELSARYALPCGFFSEAQALWYLQHDPSFPSSDFWQFNVFAGYRFAQRRVEFLVAGLNLAGQDYRLSPINLYTELPRQRTLVLSFKFNF